jgi:anaerobic C4-dicarboxylate transporter
MEKEPRNSLSMVGVGIGIGAVTMLILVLVGARVTGINLGVVEVGFPTQALSSQQNPNQPQSQVVVVITATPYPTVAPQDSVE